MDIHGPNILGTMTGNVPSGGGEIPTDDRWGDGSLQVQVLVNINTNFVDQTPNPLCRITAKDMIRSIACDANDSLTYNIKKYDGSFGTPNADPNAVYLDLVEADLANPTVMTVRVSAGGVDVDIDTYVTPYDPLGLFG